MKIVYGITVSNEIDEIQRLIPFLKDHQIKDSEIVVLVDDLTVTPEVINYLNGQEIPHYAKKLNNNFGEFKTALNVICKDIHEADYVFQLDADEMPNKVIVENVKLIIEANPDVDVFYLPRRNTVEGITTELLHEWQWVYDTNTGYINFPDYQGRIYKSNLTWVGKVHEQLNSKTYTLMPTDENFSLYHYKKIDKQIKQNNFYKNL